MLCCPYTSNASSVVLTLIGALVVTHAMLRRLISWRCIIIIIIINSYNYDASAIGSLRLGSRAPVQSQTRQSCN